MDDWSALLQSRPNILVIGRGAAADFFIGLLTPHLRSPIRSITCTAFPPGMPTDPTIILRDVDALNHDDQQRLLSWFDEGQEMRTQVVSIASTPLYTLVQAGAFLDRLYYRLNVIHLEVISE